MAEVDSEHCTEEEERHCAEEERHCAEEERHSAEELLQLYTKNIDSSEQLVERYNETSKQYDKSLHILHYEAPAKVAEVLCKLFPSNRENIKILDVAAGTGLCSEECNKHGFQLFDAVDASTGMLEEARKKGLYQKLYTAKLGTDVLDIQDDCYDAITMCGLPAYIQKSLPRAGVEEMIRLVKTGGYVITASNSSVYEDDSEYCTNTRQLETEGRWHRVQQQKVHYLKGYDCIVAVHRIL